MRWWQCLSLQSWQQILRSQQLLLFLSTIKCFVEEINFNWSHANLTIYLTKQRRRANKGATNVEDEDAQELIWMEIIINNSSLSWSRMLCVWNHLIQRFQSDYSWPFCFTEHTKVQIEICHRTTKQTKVWKQGSKVERAWANLLISFATFIVKNFFCHLHCQAWRRSPSLSITKRPTAIPEKCRAL